MPTEEKRAKEREEALRASERAKQRNRGMSL